MSFPLTPIEADAIRVNYLLNAIPEDIISAINGIITDAGNAGKCKIRIGKDEISTALRMRQVPDGLAESKARQVNMGQVAQLYRAYGWHVVIYGVNEYTLEISPKEE